MKILHIIVGLNVGGAELMLKRLIESQRKWPEFEHSVVSLTDLGLIGRDLQSQKFTVDCLGMKNALDTPRIFFRLFYMARKLRPDVVQTWMYHADLLGGLAARAAGVKNVIWGVRTTDLSKGGKRSTRIIRKLCALLSGILPTKIICAAEASKKTHAKVGYASDKMRVIPNGFDLNRLAATKEQRRMFRKGLDISDNQVVIGTLGRFNPVKDHANFISATALLAKRNLNLRFLMVGRDLENSNVALKYLIDSTGCADRYILLGERQDVPVCLAAMDIFCLHSMTEGFPNVLGEAMAMGVPCVSTDVGDAALLLDNCGVVVPAQNPVALAAGLQQMIELSEDERGRLLAMGRERIINEFSLEGASLRFRDLYNSLA